MKRVVPGLLALFLLLTPLSAAPFEEKKLVVVVVVDQMRQDQLQLYRDLYLPAPRGGFRRLAEGGVSHTRAFHDHYPTHTAVGHSSLSTGALPSVHGIVGNKILSEDGIIEAGIDPDFPIVGAEGTEAEGYSPRQQTAPTLGNTFKRASGGRSKVVSVALKDRTAVLMAGTSADAALWFDDDTGNWVTSRFYAEQLPAFVERWNKEHHPRADFGRVWSPELLPTLLPPSIGGEAALAGVARGYKGLDDRFPHVINGGHPEGPTGDFYAAWAHTPWAIDSTVRLALKALDEYKMGLDSTPDLLYVGIASLDKIGHTYGPDSPEALETLLQVDRGVAALLEGLEQRVGLKNCLVLLTADHGVTPLAEHSQSLRTRAQRVPLKPFRKRLEDRLLQRWARTDFRLELADPHLFVVPAAGKEGEKPAMLAALQDEIAQVEGVLAVFETAALARGEYRPAPYEVAIARSIFPGRSGDLLIVFQPNTTLGYSRPGGTTHGSSWTDDTHVPLLAYGWNKRGMENRTVAPRQLVSTICLTLGLTPPGGCEAPPLPWAEE
jgi:arylsulfatase A-like enzyme